MTAVSDGVGAGPDASAGRVARWSDVVGSPWKNGGGVTRELLTVPAGSTVRDFDWRISVADIERSGRFSAFDGVQRVFTVVEGQPLALTVDGVDQVVRVHEPLIFDGSCDVSCDLRSETARALNVMTRAGRSRAKVSVVSISGPRDIARTPGRELVLVVLSGAATVSGSGQVWRLATYDLVRLPDDVSPVALDGVADCAVIDIASV